MITISWHLLLLTVLAIIAFGYVMTLDNTSRMFGSERGCGLVIFFVVLAIVLLVYGGIVWW